MNYQLRGFQVSLIIHAAVFVIITGISVSAVQLDRPVVIEFGIIEDSMESTGKLIEKTPIAQEQKKMEKESEAAPAPPPQTETVQPEEKPAEKPLQTKMEEAPLKQEKEEKNEEQIAPALSEAQVPVSAPQSVPVQQKEQTIKQGNETVHAKPLVSSITKLQNPVFASPPVIASEMSRISSTGSSPAGNGAVHSASASGTKSGQAIDNLVFGSATGPRFLQKAMPDYPMVAKRMGREGKVLLRLTIDETGKLLHVEVMEHSGYGFADAAVEAVKRSTFIPARKDGRTIMARALLPVKFMLKRSE
jgi:periplasmic protein TonB